MARQTRNRAMLFTAAGVMLLSITLATAAARGRGVARLAPLSRLPGPWSSRSHKEKRRSPRRDYSAPKRS